MAFSCDTCDKTFAHKQSLNRHKKEHDSTAPMHECDFCGKKFARRDNLLQHRRVSCIGTPPKEHPVPSTSRGKKRDAPADGAGPRAKRRHVQPGGFAFKEDPTDVPENPIPQDDDVAVQNLYRQKWPTIRTQFRRSQRIQDTYNFRLNSEDPTDLADLVWSIFKDQLTVFKINLSFGFFLRDGETGALRYFHPSENNNKFLPAPVLVENDDGVRRFLDSIEDVDIMEQARQQRPNSKSVLHKMVNVTFYVNKIKGHPIGAPQTVQDYIKKSRSIIALLGDRHGPYTDKL
ncbi:uncharacterized protein [Branchiostoma lanceolatum]|uniref:uncharacterized protein n=1 Tax=Branchiostoma lanceolatum TaxID=7740 RepID=UPI0034546F55